MSHTAEARPVGAPSPAVIRPVTEADLPAFGRLLDAHLPDWGGDRGFLTATLLDHPWSDPTVGSLVAVDAEGEPVGFIGAQVRRVRFEGRSLTGVCCSHLVVAQDRSPGPVGALLLGRLVSGPQDLTWSDSATETVTRIWRMYGGFFDHTRACDWMLVLRPLGWLRSWARAAVRRDRYDRELIPVGAFPFHTVARREKGSPDGNVKGEDVSPAQIVEHLPAILRDVRVRVDYDEPHLTHLFAQIRAKRGELVTRMVRIGGRPVGWYAYLPRRTTASRVLSIATTERHSDAVLAELISDARGRGARVLAGRLEPHLDMALQRRLAAIGLSRAPVLHAKDPDLRAALAGADGLLTQLDSEWFVT
jgi:hypothetical protein